MDLILVLSYKYIICFGHFHPNLLSCSLLYPLSLDYKITFIRRKEFISIYCMVTANSLPPPKSGGKLGKKQVMPTILQTSSKVVCGKHDGIMFPPIVLSSGLAIMLHSAIISAA